LESILSDKHTVTGFLRHHVDDLPAADFKIAYHVARSVADLVTVEFSVSGAVDALSLPPWSRALRADGLWNHSCFEVFIRPGDGAPYAEFNFAPTGGWAAYQFDATRVGMRNLAGIGDPIVEAESTDATYRLRAQFDLGRIAEFSEAQIWQLGVSAVIEDKVGTKSYWALAHPPGKPDFHHNACFAQALKRPEDI
jgi:hypothetical protein